MKRANASEGSEKIFKIFLGVSVALPFLSLLAVEILEFIGFEPFDIRVFVHLFLVQDGPVAPWHLLMLLVALLASRRISAETTDRLMELLARRGWVLAVVVVPFLVAGTLWVYEDHPLSMDEYMHQFQAEIFAEGRLYGQLPPKLAERVVPPSFLNRSFISVSMSTGKAVSRYLPGFALIATPFVKLGAPWLLNPLLAAGCLLLVGAVTDRLVDDPRAVGWALLLTLSSPAFTVNAISYYNLTAHLFLNLLFVFLILDRAPLRLFAAGAVGALALTLHQPVSHALFALPWFLWMMGRREWKNLLILGCGYAPLAAFLGIGWQRVRGVIRAENALLDPTSVSNLGSALRELGIFLGVLHLPGIPLLSLRVLATLKLALWMVPGLLVLAAVVWLRRDERIELRLLGWSLVATFLFYCFVRFDQGHGWSYRYVHSAWAAFPILGAAFLAPSRRDAPRWRGLVAVLIVLSFTVGTALRLHQVHGFMERHLGQMATVEGNAPEVRFVDMSGYFTQDLVQNDPFLRGPTWIFVSFGREADREFVRRLFVAPRLVAETPYSTAWRVEGTRIPENVPP